MKTKDTEEKLKMTPEDGMVFHVNRWTELIF